MAISVSRNKDPRCDNINTRQPETAPITLGAPMFVDLPTCKLAYRDVGQGKPLLLVHGYPLHGMTFRHLV